MFLLAKRKKKKKETAFEPGAAQKAASAAFVAATHRFSPWFTCTWHGSERVSLVLESMEEALGFCRMNTEETDG